MHNIVIILNNPQLGENIGATARAMANFGIFQLRIVNPRDGWPNQRAHETASGAFDHMLPPKVYSNLPEALADCQVSYATTARSRDMVKDIFTPEQAAIHSYQQIETADRDKKIAFIFGAERTGLENDDIMLATALVHIPTNPDFSSLNLSQAVLLMAYEIHKAHHTTSSPQLSQASQNTPAPYKELDNFLMRLDLELEKGRFFREKNLKPTMIRNITNIFTRNKLTSQEIKTLHGIVSALTGNKTHKKSR